MSPLQIFWVASFFALTGLGIGSFYWPPLAFGYVIALPLFVIGARDATQRRRAVLRNFPLIGHFRYLLEAIRPEIQQYFIESDTDGRPFSREIRSVVYQRAKGVRDTRPFGTLHDLYEDGVELIAHSIRATTPPDHPPRVTIGEGRCAQPYAASLFNVSGMSFGSLSRNAIRALSGGAQQGGFFVNTGEGGVSPHHLEPGGDLVWQIGTGYFGCRDKDGRFNPEMFAAQASVPNIKMIELKLSQGAKPGHGGILPGAKVTEEIAAIRGVEPGVTVHSPPRHSTFETPIELLEFVNQLRELSGGKPVGIKLCIGRPREFMSLCKAMRETGHRVDFISVDGGEGGTGAAPLEFSNSLGLPLTEGLMVAHNVLVGTELRDDLKILASGRIATGFNIVQRLAIGADLCVSARAMMLALGCIQALRCNSNFCPVGVATQDEALVRGLDVDDKRQRIYRFHRNTVRAALEMVAAAGLDHPDQLQPDHVFLRVEPQRLASYAELYDYLSPGDLLIGRYGDRETDYDALFEREWLASSAERF